MNVKLIFKFLLLFKLLITVGCSYNRLENLGLLKEKANEYSLARKAPLIMPPDMYLRPPSSEKEEVTISNDNIEDDISLDDILVGNVRTKNQRNNKRIIKSVNNEAKILKKILDKKAVILLK